MSFFLSPASLSARTKINDYGVNIHYLDLSKQPEPAKAGRRGPEFCISPPIDRMDENLLLRSNYSAKTPAVLD